MPPLAPEIEKVLADLDKTEKGMSRRLGEWGGSIVRNTFMSSRYYDFVGDDYNGTPLTVLPTPRGSNRAWGNDFYIHPLMIIVVGENDDFHKRIYDGFRAIYRKLKYYEKYEAGSNKNLRHVIIWAAKWDQAFWDGEFGKSWYLDGVNHADVEIILKQFGYAPRVIGRIKK